MPVVRGEKGARPSPSPYFDGPKPAAVQVRAHSRAAPQKRVPLPPSLNPAADHRFDLPPKAAPVPAAAPVNNTARLEPATKHGDSKRFYQPLHPGQKPSGYEAVGRRPGRAGIGSPVTSRPYWLATRGPTGDAASQLTSAQLVTAQRAGVPKTVAMSVLEGAVHPLTDLSQQALGTRPFQLGGAVSDIANIGSNFVPVGKAAGILGGLRGLKALKVGVDVAEAAKAVPVVSRTITVAGKKTILPGKSFPEGTLFHGSPEGELGTIDPLYHTQMWREGPGFYATTSAEKATKYAAGKTAKAERLGGSGAVNVVKLKPDAKVLDLDAQPESFWRDIAAKLTGEPVDEKLWRAWATDIRPEDRMAKGASEGVLNRLRLMHFLTGYEELPKTDAYYAIEEVIHDAGYQATLHHEGDIPVYIVKDTNAIEHLGAHQPGDLLPRTVTGPPRTVRLPPPMRRPLPPPLPADVLRATFKGARGVRGKQEAGYSVERSKRVAAANVHLTNQSLAPAERLALAKNELKGELPKIDFQGMKVLDDQALAKLQTHILDHPHLMPFQKITASTALANAVAGKVPTKSELTLLEHVFGKATADSLGQIHNHPFKNTILGVLNVPRSLMASFDLSAPFRQGLVVSIRHPTVFARNFGPMLKAFGSEKVYHAMLDEIHTRPTYPMMMEAKLSLTELGSKVGAREEQFASDPAEKLNLRSIPGPLKGKKYATGPGDVVRASARAYTGFLDKTRADVFDHLIGRAQAQGVNVQDTKFLKDLGRYINSATGRGPLGNLQGAAPALNAVFFSPRLLASRLDLIFSPISYAKADPFVRREALKSMVAFAGTLSTLLAVAAQAPGVKVVLDPRNPDWGKIRVGNTRVDIGGGFQQPLRLFAQLATGTAISSTTGKKLNLTAGGFGQPNRLDLFLRFFEGKESPIASLVTDKMRNSNQVGTPFTWKAEVSQRLIPLLAQDSYDLYHAQHGGMNGIAAAFAGYGIGSVGFGIQNYGPAPPKRTTKKPQSYFGSSGSSGGSPYFGSPASTGGGGGYFK